MKLLSIYRESKKSDSNFFYVVASFLYYRLFGKNILASVNTIIKGLGKIDTQGLVKIGLRYQGFMTRSDKTYLNVRGRLVFLGKFSVSKGCRFDIGPNAIMTLGEDGYVNANTIFIISHSLIIGARCIISWNCQFLDEDFHSLNYPGKKQGITNDIKIGNDVWIGNNCFIYKGSVIADGCVVAANTIIKGVYLEENCLIAGNPAIVIKRNVVWH